MASDTKHYSVDDITSRYEEYRKERFLILNGPEGTYAYKSVDTNGDQTAVPLALLTDAEKQYFATTYTNFKADNNTLPPLYQQKIDDAFLKANDLQVEREQAATEYRAKKMFSSRQSPFLLAVFCLALIAGISGTRQCRSRHAHFDGRVRRTDHNYRTRV